MLHSLLQRLHSIDRRWIYLVLAVTFVVSLLLGRPVNPIVLPYVQNLYNAIEKAPASPNDHRLILVGMTFSPSTRGESFNQARAIVRHLMIAHKRFAIVSVGEQQGSILGYQITEDIAKQYGYKYGEDWISFGFQPNSLAFYTSFPRDIPNTIEKDYRDKKPVASFPIMQGIKTLKDNIAMHIEITASASVFNWIQYVQGRYGLKIGYACTGVMAAEAYPLLDSGQLDGMLPGLKGAADYEKLVDALEARDYAAGLIKVRYDAAKSNPSIMPETARKLMFTQSAAHIAIIVFIILGNIGMLLARRREKHTNREAA